MSKIRIVVSFALEFEPDVYHYPIPNNDINQMLEMAKYLAMRDPYFIVNDGEMTVNGEIIN